MESYSNIYHIFQCFIKIQCINKRLMEKVQKIIKFNILTQKLQKSPLLTQDRVLSNKTKLKESLDLIRFRVIIFKVVEGIQKSKLFKGQIIQVLRELQNRISRTQHSLDHFREAISRSELNLWHSLPTKRYGLDQQISPHLIKLV